MSSSWYHLSSEQITGKRERKSEGEEEEEEEEEDRERQRFMLCFYTVYSGLWLSELL